MYPTLILKMKEYSQDDPHNIGSEGHEKSFDSQSLVGIVFREKTEHTSSPLSPDIHLSVYNP